MFNITNTNARAALPIPRNHRNVPQENSRLQNTISAVSHAALSLTITASIAMLYYTRECKISTLIYYGFPGFGLNCGNVEKSMTINFLLPAVAVAAAIRAKNCFNRAME